MPSADRRRYERFDLHCRLRYQVTLEGTLSEINVGDSKNISQGGLLLNVNWPLPVGAMLSLEFEADVLRKYIKLDNLKNYVEIESSPFNVVKLFGFVTRCVKLDDGSYDVGVELLNK